MSNKPRWCDPESWTFKEQETKLKELYLELYPWHNTQDAKSYDYPTFYQAIRDWASDDFYAQHLTAKLYCETVDWMFKDPINVWQYDQ